MSTGSREVEQDLGGRTGLREGVAVSGRRRLRHHQTRGEILSAAWMLARRDGVAGLSLRTVAQMVGMEPPSLYTYFTSKHDLYDAMFAQANQLLLDRQRALLAAAGTSTARERLAKGVEVFVEFCAEDAARFSLMFQRPIPGFAPSTESMDLARQVLDDAVAALHGAGIRDQASIDIFLAMTTGIASQQVSNEPGGRRWVDLVPRAVDLLLGANSG